MNVTDPLDKEFIFIVGSPRSGTTWLHTILSGHPKVASIAPVELTHFSNYIPSLIRIWNNQKKNLAKNPWEHGLASIWSDDEFDHFLRSFTRDVYRKILDKNPGATHIADKHPNYSNFLPAITKVLPNARIVHIIRDGRDVVVSSKSVNKRRGFMHAETEVMAKKWKTFVTNAIGYRGNENYFELKYEDLLGNNRALLADLFRFCGLEATEDFLGETINRNKLDKNPVSSANTAINSIRENKKEIYRSNLTLEERYIFALIAGDLLKKLGYEADPEWIFLDPKDKLKLAGIKLKHKVKNFRSND
jgi:hypothetical protein